jgi:hypothetical protein
VIFLAAGAGAVARSIQNKARDILSLKDFGAVGDGVADDRPAATSMLTAGTGFVPAATFKMAASLTLPANRSLLGHGLNSVLAFTAANGLVVGGSNASLQDVQITAAGATPAVASGANQSQVAIRGASIVNTGGTAVQLNGAAPKNWTISSSYIYGDGYALLPNGGAAGGDGLVVNGCQIVSNKADAIELNFPNIVYKNISITGNILSALNNGAGASAGFGLGVAAAQNTAFVGNVITESRNEAIHIEDGQSGNTFVGNVLANCRSDGIKYSIDGAGAGLGKPFIAMGNQILSATNNGTVGNGIWRIYDAGGTLSRCIIKGNHIQGFAVGVYHDGPGQTVLDGNVFDGCPTVVSITGSPGTDSAKQNRIIGTNVCTGANTFVQTGNGNLIVGKIIATDAAPATILAKTIAGGPGASILGFAFPVIGLNHGGAGAQTFNLFPVSSRMAGRLRVSMTSATGDSSYRDANVKWNGA